MSDDWDSEEDEREYDACVGYLMRALLCPYIDDDYEIEDEQRTQTQSRVTLH
jgi:hypothetical protein